MTDPAEAVHPSSRIYLHVGSPKTGTTFLQQVLWSQRELAKEQGLLLPLDSFGDHYLASLDVRRVAHLPQHPDRAEGIWKRFVEQSVAWSGSVLISHELFAGATAKQAREAIAAFGPDAEVHVIVTARDLVRQIPAEWQEHVKHRSTRPFAEFIERVESDTDTWFWRVQDFSDVLDRWGAALPPERVHLVTVPARGTPPEVLWRRFAGLLGLDPDTYDLAGSRSNSSLGYEQAELLRRVNADLGARLPLPGPYPADVKTVFAQSVLAQRAGTRVELPARARKFAVARSAEIAARIADLGVDVVGDLAELVPDADVDSSHDLDYDVSDEVLLSESVAALSGLLDEHRARRLERDEALRGLHETRASLHGVEHRAQELESERAHLLEELAERDRYINHMADRPFRTFLIRLSERWRWLMFLRRANWRLMDAVRRAVRRGRDEG